VGASLTACRGGETTTDTSGVKTDIGVTKEPCPQAINKNKGCIYLGTISDLTDGPFHALAVPITDAQKAFWKRVNAAGGIGNYEVDVTKYVRDNHYNPQTHKEVYEQIKGNVLALAQTLGLADDGRDPARPEGQQRRRRTGLRGLAAGRSRTWSSRVVPTTASSR
jgi:hypothetical protein